MPEMFPVKRFRGAGATKEETDQLVREFEHSDLGMQQSIVEHFKPQSRNAIREYVENLRHNGHFGKSPERAPEADSDDFDDEPSETTTKAKKSKTAPESTEPESPDVVED